MIKANIEAAIEAKQKKRDQIFNDLERLEKVITNLKEQKHKLLEEESELCFEIEELKDQLGVVND